MIYQDNTINVKVIQSNIAQLTFSAPSSVNTLNLATLKSLDKALDAIKKETQLTGLILASDKSSFIVGADIKEFLGLFSQPEEKLDQWIQYSNSIFNKLEDLSIPTLSMIKGYALGGGCECILSTDFRIADKTAVIGLPETKLGIIPGFGGTVRLARLIGADNAMEMIATAKQLKAPAAIKLRLIDALVETEALEQSAIDTLMQAIDGKIDWQDRRQQKKAPLNLNPTESLMSFSMAKGMISQKAGPHYPAPLSAVKAIEEASSLSRDEALNIERKYFVKMAKTDVTQALVGLFLSDQYIKGLAKKAAKSAPETNSSAVLGAGIMGGGIAYQSAVKGVPVLMKDIADASLDLGMQEASKLLNKQLEKKRITGLSMAKTLSSIKPTLNYAGIEQADVIVEAVVENPKIKASVLSEVEALSKEDAVIASNTSTIPINQLAKSMKRPELFCGMHFFNPVHRMPLVEIIRGEKTSEKTIETIVAYAAKMGKSPIVVNDCPGFFVNRVLFPYFGGFSLLLKDGGDFTQIDKVMEKKFGWPMGPAYLLDVVGLDTAHHAQAVMAEGFPERMGKNGKDAIDALFENNKFGQKNSSGFYQYSVDKRGKPKKEFDAKVLALFEGIHQETKEFTEDEIINRTMIPMINEVVRCLEEKIIASPQEADMALVYGLGFPPFRGGVFRYLDTIGLDNYIQTAEKYQSISPMYQVPNTLYEMAKNNELFYPVADALAL